MMKKIVFVVIVAVLMLSLVALSGCEKDVTPDAEVSATLPEGFPADVPVYDGTIVDSDESEGESGMGYTVDVAATGAVGDVVAWYESELAGEGWMTATASMPNGTGNVITGDKEGQSVIVTVLEGDDGTDLSVVYAPAD